MRTGWGFDAHRIGSVGPMRIGGVTVDEYRGLIGTSDADVALHALADAILGAAALGDLGTHFPSSDEQWRDADSSELLRKVVGMAEAAGHTVDSVDVTVIAQTIRIAPHREEIRARLSEILGTPLERVSVKATTTDGMGYLGRDEGIAATAVAVLR
ncbi:MAG: 2-C-methyl-D-erythritol 2,4-cyclodiphosphate synthase [bacterium]|nr:2-C-methyl-D-erythritol 2,4-cyclodiphosphate synthase [bacterium]MCP4964375.1 2-C-methyl-D-erythritol 2,4-cyclodiphosphate synthase [bacterium]